MYISKDDLTAFARDGYLLKPAYFSEAEVETMKGELNAVFHEDAPHRILENNGFVRSVYGVHVSNEIFRRLVRHPKLLGPAMEILQSQVYVYQFKINAKAAMGGDIWEWHQDFIFWNKEDGLREPRIVNMSIFLDDVTEFNGPLMFIPGSHQSGMVDMSAGTPSAGNKDVPAWTSNLTADLKYSSAREVIAELTSRGGIVAPKGPAGSLLLFDANIFHGSSSNMSPLNRAMIIVSYNSVNNLPEEMENPRPEFLVSRDYSPLAPLAEDCLVEARSH